VASRSPDLIRRDRATMVLVRSGEAQIVGRRGGRDVLEPCPRRADRVPRGGADRPMPRARERSGWGACGRDTGAGRDRRTRAGFDPDKRSGGTQGWRLEMRAGAGTRSRLDAPDRWARLHQITRRARSRCVLGRHDDAHRRHGGDEKSAEKQHRSYASHPVGSHAALSKPLRPADSFSSRGRGINYEQTGPSLA